MSVHAGVQQMQFLFLGESGTIWTTDLYLKMAQGNLQYPVGMSCWPSLFIIYLFFCKYYSCTYQMLSFLYIRCGVYKELLNVSKLLLKRNCKLNVLKYFNVTK